MKAKTIWQRAAVKLFIYRLTGDGGQAGGGVAVGMAVGVAITTAGEHVDTRGVA